MMNISVERRGAILRYATGTCSLGSILVGSSEEGVCAILLGGDPETLLDQLRDRFPDMATTADEGELARLVAKIIAYIEAPVCDLDLPLDIRGTAFQRRVWQVLRHIPAGSTVSYADVAGRIGSPKSVRAVAQACARNAIAVAIPCHRVIRSDGGLSGYRWGVARKQALLTKEAAR
jgi:AraC family transcriptional regulator of adaptative response/methylated-DNA-[protein]-cysteine methyltransferase